METDLYRVIWNIGRKISKIKLNFLFKLLVKGPARGDQKSGVNQIV